MGRKTGKGLPPGTWSRLSWRLEDGVPAQLREVAPGVPSRSARAQGLPAELLGVAVAYLTQAGAPGERRLVGAPSFPPGGRDRETQ